MIDLDELERLENAAIWLSSQKGNADLHGTLEYIDIYDTKEAVLLLHNALPALLECARVLEWYGCDRNYNRPSSREHSPASNDYGNRARAALAKLRGSDE